MGSLADDPTAVLVGKPGQGRLAKLYQADVTTIAGSGEVALLIRPAEESAEQIQIDDAPEFLDRCFDDVIVLRCGASGVPDITSYFFTLEGASIRNNYLGTFLSEFHGSRLTNADVTTSHNCDLVVKRSGH